MNTDVSILLVHKVVWRTRCPGRYFVDLRLGPVQGRCDAEFGEIESGDEVGFAAGLEALAPSESAEGSGLLLGGLARGGARVPAEDGTHRWNHLLEQGTQGQEITEDAGREDLDQRPLDHVDVIPC